jgi:hypothetical protein
MPQPSLDFSDAYAFAFGVVGDLVEVDSLTPHAI